MSAPRSRPIPAPALLTGAVALVGLSAAALFLRLSPATWGVVHPKALPGLLAPLAALGTPILLALLARAAASIPRDAAVARALRSPWPWVALLVLAGLVVPNTHPYGDAVRFYKFVPHATGPESNAPLSFEAHRLMAALLPQRLVTAFTLLSTVGGILMVPGLFRLARALFPEPAREGHRDLFLLGMAGSGAWQMFVGYVEHYHVQLALVVWGLAFLIEDGSGKTRRRGPLLIGLAAAWDLSGAWLFPAIALTSWLRPTAEGGGLAARLRETARACAGLLAPVAATIVLITIVHGPAAVLTAYRGGFHPLATPHAGFLTPSEWFASSHLQFLANDLVLVAPLAAALAIPLALGRLGRGPRVASSGADAADGATRRALLLVFSLAFAFFWNPRLGWLADWDLFAWPLFLAQVFALEAALRREPEPPRRAAWIPLLAAAQSLAVVYLLANSRLGVAR